MVYCLNPTCPEPHNSPTANFCAACGTPLVLAGRYRIRALLGEGGFGRTFLAADAAENRCVVKQIYSRGSVLSLDAALARVDESGDSSEQLAASSRFRREAERLRRLGEHPQIPRLIEAVENELGQFLVQQFAPGENLDARVQKGGPWTQGDVRSLLESLIPVLQYVHSFDIIHRDIKPANIVATGESEDSDSLPMLVDFGAAKWVRQNVAETVIGSAGYAAPEQSMGQATFASDIYSLGLTCLYLLTSVHPFSLYSAAEDRWVWQDYLPQPVEPRFAQVLDKMVARSLQQRYKTMDEVALDLQFSQNPLHYSPKQLLTLAKDSARDSAQRLAEPIKNALQLSETAVRPTVAVAQTWRRRHRITKAVGVMGAIATSPSLFVTAGASGSIRLWHLESGQLVHRFQRRRLMGDGHTDRVTALAFHPDGRALYSASSDRTIKEWDCEERCLLNTIPTGGWRPTDLAITADGEQIISPNSDGEIVLWDVDTLLPSGRLAQHQKRVGAIALLKKTDSASAMRVLASASDDGTVKLWKYPQGVGQSSTPLLAKTISMTSPSSRKPVFGEALGRSLFGRKAGLQNKAVSVAQSSEREGAIAVALYVPTFGCAAQLVVATASGSVQLFDLDDQLNAGLPKTLYQSPYPITAFDLSVDGYLAVGSEDSVVTLWQLETGDCVAKLAHDWGMSAISFSPNGQHLVTASADEIITVWQRENIV